MVEPYISVIIPLPDHRGHGDEVIASWVSGQCLPADRYEILLVAGPADALWLERLRPRLRSGDMAWVEASDEILFLNHQAAARARGTILLFTESHCRGHRDCLLEIVSHFENQHAVTAQCRHINILENRYAVMEHELEGGFFEQNDDAYWNRLRKRAFAIRKSVYESSGGFEHRYGYFSERALAATLRRRNLPMDWLPNALVFHYNTNSLDTMRPHHEDYAKGMCLYRSSRPAVEVEGDFGPLPLWDSRAWWIASHRLAVLRAVTGAAIEKSIHRPWTIPGQLKRVAVLAINSLSSLRLAIFFSHARAGLARIMTQWAPGSKGAAYRWYVSYWRAIVHRMQLRTILVERASPNYRSDSTTHWDAADFGDCPHFGFHGLEQHNLRRMRWTGPSAFILLRSPGASGGKLKIQLNKAGPTVREADLKIRVGSHRINGDCSLDAWTLECSLPVNVDEFPVIFVCGKTRIFPGDPRRLGCAVESLEIMQA